MRIMGRTNIVIDDELMARVMKLYDLPTKRAAVQFALESLVGKKRYRPRDLLDLEGIGWEGNLEAMRRARYPEW